MQSWEIHITGIVQGVGFRPFVYQLAQQKNLKGTVSNGSAGVKICFNESQENAEKFYQAVLAQKPSIAQVRSSRLQSVDKRFFDKFGIIESEEEGPKTNFFAPDYALCEQCRQEMRDPNNRRFGYPFITCTQCGPRYSIISNLPYDRPYTSMADYQMCSFCEAEYHNPLDRRHYSQTNSCASCGIKLTYYAIGERSDMLHNPQQIIAAVCKAWQEGKIIAIKGIGGFLLTCDASNAESIKRLRALKSRPSKPFAVMFPELDALGERSVLERGALLDEVSPIVLLTPDSYRERGTLSQAGLITGGLDQVGVMIPYTPLYQLLLDAFGKAIIATSANRGNAPICYEDESRLSEICDFVLSNDRAILVPQDDSVIRFSSKHQQKIIIRRSRGMAPSFFPADLALPNDCILAFGADMKASFSLLHQGNIYISQYLGDLSHYDTQQQFTQVSEHMMSVLRSSPTKVLHDLHPNYASTRLATDFTQKQQIQNYAYQHHKAHFGAVLAENGLLDQDEKVLGFCWDGTGYGSDGNIWGSECFSYQDRKIERRHHLDYFPVIGGDKLSREPRLAALAILGEMDAVADKFSEMEQKVYAQLLPKASLQSSSMGRLFDAAASVLGICDRQSYEGEAAMKLEALATRFYQQNPRSQAHYPIDNTFSGKALLQSMKNDLEQQIPLEQIAFRFHNSFPAYLHQQAVKHQSRHLCMSGGVFQNALLVDLIIDQLGADFQLCFHKQLSPNDENISFGQLILHLLETHKTK
ncbi:MAG: carbamoyltransferase HypF [Bacteroidota bacterium]